MTNNANRLVGWFVIAGSLAIGVLACSSDSLWIDEAWMARIASAPTLAGWWDRMREVSGSTLQMPLYTLYLWAWEKVAGHSEWALRAANIPFFILGQWALWRCLREDKWLAVWTGVIVAVSPFVWSYLAEARPYMMQFGGGCLVLAGLIQLARGTPLTTRDLVLFCAGLFLLCGSSALGFPWAGSAVFAAVVLVWRERTLVVMRLRNVLLLAGAALVLSLIFVYDIWATRSGGTASAVGRTGFANLVFAAYELLGFAGLGPGRLALREAPSLSTLVPYLLPLAGLAIALVGAFLHWRAVPGRIRLTFFLYSVLPLVLVIALARVAPFRLLGRHLMPLAPVLLVSLAYAASSSAKWKFNRWFIALWLISALTLRFHPRHERDDYRTAARRAQNALAQDQTVWWSADVAGAIYYGLPLAKSAQETGAVLVIGPTPQELERLPAPNVVVASRPDVFDGAGVLGRFVAANGYAPAERLPAFTIWRRPAPAAVEGR